MPAACEAMGYEKRNSCGWLESMLDALLAADPALELCLLGFDWRPCDVQIGRVRHVSFEVGGRTWYKKIPSDIVEKAHRLIKEFSPDVIHVQGTEYFYGCFPQEVYCGKPVVVSIQGLLSGLHVAYTGGISPKELRGTNWNAGFLLKGRTLYSEQTSWREKRAKQEQKLLRQQNNFIGRTEWDESVVRYYNPHARYFKVNENIRPQFFKVRRESIKIRRHSIYCGAAMIYPLKGVHWLIRAVASLKEEFPDIELRIAAADGLKQPKGLRSVSLAQSYYVYLRRLVRQLGVEKNVVALPSLSADLVAEELKSAELFVLPSLGENSPNSLGEAMLVGTPAIATCVGGVPSILKDGVEGRLVPPSDPFALAGAIRRWFLHPEEAEACVEPARATALKRHNAKANAEATLEVYRELAN